MRPALPAVLAVLLLTGCSGAQETAPAPNPAPSSTAAVAPLLPAWSATLDTLAPGDCEVDPYGEVCLDGMQVTQTLATELAEAARLRGPRYAGVEREARKVAEAAQRWHEHCAFTRPYSAERWSCLDTLATVRLGGTTIRAQLLEVEPAAR